MTQQEFFFSGLVEAKIDDKNRFVLPQSMRYGLVENGALEFTISIGLNGSLSIYRKSDMEKIVKSFKEKQHVAKYQKFFTLFFSTLYHTTCDKLGRVVLPSILRKAAHIDGEIVIAGVGNKLEVWARDQYFKDLDDFLQGGEESLSVREMMEEAFSLVGDEGKGKKEEKSLPQEKLQELLSKSREEELNLN